MRPKNPDRIPDEPKGETLLWSVVELARQLRISRNMAFNLLRDGHIRRVRIGARTMVLADEARAFALSSVEVKGGEE